LPDERAARGLEAFAQDGREFGRQRLGERLEFAGMAISEVVRAIAAIAGPKAATSAAGENLGNGR
jgi:hypothetical protein